MTGTTRVAAQRQRSRHPSIVVASTLFVLLMGSNLPAPLYSVYQERFGFSTSVLTLVFATYAAVLIPSLIVFGQLSDQVGRKRVLLGALGVSAVGLALFIAARGPVWLFAARAAQGLAVGSAGATATAALVELARDGDEGRAALGAVIGQAGGAATGPLIAGMLAEWAPAPQVLCYVVGLGVTAAVAVALLRLPEPATRNGRWRLQRPSVPTQVRSPFARASLTAMCVWMVGALFLSIVPTYAGMLLDTDSLVVRTLPTAFMLLVACLAHAVALRASQSPSRLQVAGLASLVAGSLLLAGAWPLRSLGVMLLGAVAAGAGLGLGFGGSQTELNQIAPSDRRGEVTAAYVTIVYAGIVVSSLITGWLSDRLGIPQAIAIASGAIAVASVVIGWWQFRAARA